MGLLSKLFERFRGKDDNRIVQRIYFCKNKNNTQTVDDGVPGNVRQSIFFGSGNKQSVTRGQR